ncbi:Imm49 family immunity protein [Salinirubrum litoreum]|uniref:Imm49 family immunity protein n=1 Tax=Salinirubrum litoreum TaxID=1126234 RepID=A0ABD5RDK5_9EURY|nr:Imm49 family immunity protein [Salinirubrum litoreum]
MTFTDETLRDHLERSEAEVRRMGRLWNEDKVPVDGVPGFAYSAAKAYEQLACTAALLGAVSQSRRWFGTAASLHYERVVSGRLRRDSRERMVWEAEPRKLSEALTTALLSRDEKLSTGIARDAVALDEAYLDEFADEYPDSVASYYQTRVKAALVLDDERASEWLSKLVETVETLSDPSRYWQVIPEFYRALDGGDEEAAESAIGELLEFYVERDTDPDEPRKYVLRSLCALVLLARRHDVHVAVDSARVPKYLVQEAVPDDDRRLDVDVSDVTATSRVGFFDLERDEDGIPVIVARMYQSGRGDITADDVPEREAGRILSDDWIEAALDEARWRDHYDDSVVEDAATAYRDGSLLRKLVVVQDRTDGGTFDDTLSALPVDTIQLLKGAGRR